MKKRVLSIILVLLIIVSLFPTASFAEGPEENDPVNGPYDDTAAEEKIEEYPSTLPDDLAQDDARDDPDDPEEASALAFVLQPEDGEFPAGESYAFSWELSFVPDRLELRREEKDGNGEGGELRLCLVEELPVDAQTWEIDEPGTYRIRAWLGENYAMSDAFTVTAAPVEEDDPRGDLAPAEEVATLPSEGEINANSGACGDLLTWTFENGTLTISGTGDMWNWGESVANGAPWYSIKNSITSVVIESGVTSIGDYAFCNPTRLKSVTIPDGVASIGVYSFNICYNLDSLELPSSVTSIGDRAFYHCSGLTSLTIPENVTSIGNGAFSGCISLQSSPNLPLQGTQRSGARLGEPGQNRCHHPHASASGPIGSQVEGVCLRDHHHPCLSLRKCGGAGPGGPTSGGIGRGPGGDGLHRIQRGNEGALP